MKGSLTLVLLFCIISFSYAQTDPKKGMAYDKENAMYYRISNDEQYLYLNFYKDEYVQKITSLGGIKIFLNMNGKKDTMNVPYIVYPVYNRSKKDYEEIETSGFSGVPEGRMSVFNEYGIMGESKIIALSGKNWYSKDRSVFQSQVTIPLNGLRIDKNKNISIMILLRGLRLVQPPLGAIRGAAMNSNLEEEALWSHIDDWTWSWVEYELK
ncbi:hypothetical protein [Sphingobacterium paucimobilis]|uniref:Uncharacterized protein n=2 Tax=Sphingobacterium TaxID=28453 RepID=U2HX97_9SPHI|nr:hypothetical protein [Sphingobacterium paucimobilis]ERJ60162.1 hypothetical protein M472_15470 [Sphingobacterium paucimobilis HER1398]